MRMATKRGSSLCGIGLLRVLLVLLFAGLWTGMAFGQSLDWAKRAGGTSSDYGQGIAVDSDGNSYVIGQFSGTATFGPGETNETVLTSAGSSDIFVAKYASNGALLWAERAGGTTSDQGYGITVDSGGNSYVTGQFSGTATFGPGETNEAVLTSAGTFSDIFVAKYASNGALVWAKRAGGTMFDAGRGIAVDSGGNSYVTGLFNGTATFGPGETNQTVLTSAGIADIFVAKYDSNGALLWAKRAGGLGGESGQAIAVDSSGNSYVTGPFDWNPTFGPGETNETVLTSGGVYNIFVAKYASNGALVWAKWAGGTSSFASYGTAVDSSGNSYVTGQLRGTATFGPGETNETALTSAGLSDIFVAKYDSNGALVWAKRAGGTMFDEGYGIAVDSGGNGYVTGMFDGTATFGPGETNETVLTSAGSSDIFVAKHASNGALLWAKRAGGTTSDQGYGIAVDSGGNSYVTGPFSGTATFGPGETNETVQTSAGSFDVFVARYAGPAEAGFVTGAGWIQSDPGFCSLNALCASADGHARFGFFSRYQKGAQAPIGQTDFNFSAGQLNFHSGSYQWMVVDGPLVKYKGSGTINGTGDYGFLLTAQDSNIIGGPAVDTFRIKIWDNATGNVVYHNGTNQPIEGGSIVIHK